MSDLDQYSREQLVERVLELERYIAQQGELITRWMLQMAAEQVRQHRVGAQ